MSRPGTSDTSDTSDTPDTCCNVNIPDIVSYLNIGEDFAIDKNESDNIEFDLEIDQSIVFDKFGF